MDVPDVQGTGMSTVVEAWLDARSRGDLDRLARLTAPDANWHDPLLGTSSGRGAVVERVRAAFTNGDEFATSLLSLYSGAAVAIALVRDTCTGEGGRRHSQQTLFIRVAGDQVAEIWSVPSRVPESGRSRPAPPTADEADPEPRRPARPDLTTWREAATDRRRARGPAARSSSP